MKKQVHVYYSGRVQGIGFRFTAARLAEELDISGWVKNLADTRVELVAEGTQERINDLLTQLNNNFSNYIQDTEVVWGVATGKFKDFGVKF